MGDFAGWEVALHYGSATAEHLAVRASAGAFDVSHMGRIETAGPGALALLERVFTNDIGRVQIGGAQYTVLCREDGGVLDDVISYRLGAERFLTVTNAANHERDLSWFADHAGDRVSIIDRSADYAMIAVQGPLAREIVRSIASAPLPARMTVGELTLNGVDALVAGTGYTGEDGVELLVEPAHQEAVWNAILRRGAVPAGLVARDTLRSEVCYPLYGNELSTERGPIEAGLGWCCRSQGGYIGARAIAAVRAAGPVERLAPFIVERGLARRGNAVVGGGVVTTGTYSPSLKVGIGMAYLRAERSQSGTEIEIEVRGQRRRARVEARPLLRR
jgi:aminomethyltransferase